MYDSAFFISTVKPVDEALKMKTKNVEYPVGKIIAHYFSMSFFFVVFFNEFLFHKSIFYLNKSEKISSIKLFME